MKEQVKEIEQVVKDYCNKQHNCDEGLFNIGIELGKILERNKIKEHRLQFFCDKEEKENVIRSYSGDGEHQFWFIVNT